MLTSYFIKLYLMSLQYGSQVLAQITFPFPHLVCTGDNFAYQEEHDRARIPYRLQSEVCLLTLNCIALLRSCETRWRLFVMFKITPKSQYQIFMRTIATLTIQWDL